MQKETRFKEKVRRKLKDIPESFWVKIQQVSIRGTPDFLGVVKGRFIALELKVDDNKPDALQSYNIREVQLAGGFAQVVTPNNLDATVAILRAL